MKQERQYLTAITIVGGIITLLDMTGNICYYRQRGIGKLTDVQRHALIRMGLLQKNWDTYKELPSYISIHFEDPSIMGKARATYPKVDEILKVFQASSNLNETHRTIKKSGISNIQSVQRSRHI